MSGLDPLLSVHASRLQGLLTELTGSIEETAIPVSYRFLHLDYPGTPSCLDDLANVMVDALVDYCIPYSKRSGVSPERLAQLTRKAAGLFIRNDVMRKRSGEPGELLLYLLCEGIFGAPKVASKLFHKSNPNSNVLGADAVHVLPNDSLDGLTVYWGESKLYGRLPRAIADLCQSMASMQEGASGGVGRERDLEVVCDFADLEIPDGPEKDLILDRLDPYAPDPTAAFLRGVVYHHACFVGFSLAQVSRLLEAGGANLAHELAAAYTEAFAKARAEFGLQVIDLGIEQLDYTLVLLPVESVSSLRLRFYKKVDALR